MNCIHAPQNHRPHWAIVNLLLVTAALLFMMSSCMTYERAVKKYGHMAKDSIHVTVRDTVTIPKDSVIVHLNNDTITTYKEIQQGRTKVIVERTHTQTTIKATCEADTIYLQKIVTLPPVVKFGIAPWFKNAFYITLGLLLMIALIVYFFVKSRSAGRQAAKQVAEDQQNQVTQVMLNAINEANHQKPTDQ